ncbi:MAG: RDD family protein, partial [Cellvibrionales bacterium]|nr:RDD family protein [Cellvibrionales bacterium]
MESSNLNYIGFWPRVGASLIDLAILGVLTAPILTFHYGESYWVREEFGLAGPLDFILSYAFPALAVILFWSVKQATPGKMAIH